MMREKSCFIGMKFAKLGFYYNSASKTAVSKCFATANIYIELFSALKFSNNYQYMINKVCIYLFLGLKSY